MDAEAGHHLVEDEQRPVRGRQVAQALEEAFHREDEAHVPGDRLDDDRGDLARVLGEEPLDRSEVVVGGDERVLDRARSDAGRVRQPERRDARSRLDEQHVGVTVVAARELHDLPPLRERAREPERAHRRLGPRAHEADELDRRAAPSGSASPARARAGSAHRSSSHAGRPPRCAATTRGCAWPRTAAPTTGRSPRTGCRPRRRGRPPRLAR